MGFFGTGFKDAVITKALESIRTATAGKVAPYFECRSVLKDQSGYHASLVLNGSFQEINVSVANVSFSGDGRFVRISGTNSDVAWVRNGLRDFCEGQDLPVPEQFVSYTSMLVKLL